MADREIPGEVNILGTEYGIEVRRISENPDLNPCG